MIHEQQEQFYLGAEDLYICEQNSETHLTG